MRKSKKHKKLAQQKRKARKALRKKRKDALRHKKQSAQFTSSFTGISLSHRQIKKSNQYPIHEIRISNNWQENGLAYIWLSRKTPLAFIIGVYLVDVRCLGLKNTFVSACKTEQEYEDDKTLIEKKFQDSFRLKTCSYELANIIIYGGIAYAEQFGFQPQKDFHLSKYVLGDKIRPQQHIQFGDEDGKPFFINGPDDDVDFIIQKLTKAVGKDGFHFLLQTSPEEFDE